METKPASAGLSRRALLRGGLAGVALASLGGIGVALQPSRPRALPSAGLSVLSPAEYATLAAIAERACPAPREGVPGANELDVAAMADAMFANAEPDVREGLKLGLRIVESGLAGAVFFERVRPFTHLSGEERDRVLLAMRDSRVSVRRTLFRALTSLASSLYYGDPRTWPSIGYEGPPDPSALRAAYAENLVDLGALRAPAGQGAG
jgi:hypothetical protein